MSWITCQIGAREHYAIPRALAASGSLSLLATDIWIRPDDWLARPDSLIRLRDRWHPGLAEQKVLSANSRMLSFEGVHRLKGTPAWQRFMQRNELFQKSILSKLSSSLLSAQSSSPITTLFSYSYAARDMLRFAKGQGWRTVLGQIDPGPEEERIVLEEHQRYPWLAPRWRPAPKEYWDYWRQEIELSDRIIVNSDWSRECLAKSGVPGEKMEVIPLALDGRLEHRDGLAEGSVVNKKPARVAGSPLRVLFLGQIGLRKGAARLLEAMRLIEGEPVELILVGPTEIDPRHWSKLSNVQWFGSVARSGVGRFYRDADIFILPTLSDGFALTQLEALSYGTPVLASRNCGAVVRQGVNGWLLDDLRPETIASTLLELSATYRQNQMTIDISAIDEFGFRDLSKKLLGL